MNLTGAQLRAALADRLLAGTTMMAASGPFNGVSLDSRTTGPGDLFVALKGERADGHDFIPEAVARGAVGVLATRVSNSLPAPAALVEEPLAALQALAHWWRRQCPAEVIAVTGSVGKTSTKELIAAVLSERFPVHRSPGNLNSESGLPVALLGLEQDHRYAVLEMAMYDLGEIALLCRLAEPRYGVVTNIGPVHLERLGTMERIAQAKGELLEALPINGVAVLNGDDPLVRSLAHRTRARVVWYGREPSNDVWAGDVESHGLNGLSFRLQRQGRSELVRTPLAGRHHVHNALAAAAVAVSVGMSLEEVAVALERRVPQPRLVVREGWNGCTVLDDTYNASPASMQAALDLFAEIEGRHVAVLGDMRELGSAADQSHRDLGRQLAGRAQVLVAVGELARLTADEAGRSGVETHWVSDADAAAVLLGRLVLPSDVVLVKGSRALELERLVERLTAQPAVAGGMA